LQKSGNQVTFLVKEKYLQETKDATLMLQYVNFLDRLPLIGQFFHTPAFKWKVNNAITLEQMEKGGKAAWDFAISTISSAAIREGGFLDRLAKVLEYGKGKTILVSLSSSPLDKKIYLQAGFQEDRLLEGFSSFSAWYAPIPRERFVSVRPVKLADGKVQYPIGLTALEAIPFSGNKDLAKPLMKGLDKGGLRTKYSASQVQGFLVGAVIVPLMLCLEMQNFSFWQLAWHRQLGQAVSGMREATEITALSTHAPWAKFLKFFFWRITLQVFLLLSPFVAPFDLEAFFALHFTKVRDQSIVQLHEMIKVGEENQISVNVLKEIAAKCK